MSATTTPYRGPLSVYEPNPDGLYYEPLPDGLYLKPQHVVDWPLFELFPNSPLDPCGFSFDNSEIDALGAY